MLESNISSLNAASPDGGWLQSEVWRAFQGSAGHRTFHFESEGAWANVIEHTLPMVGKYWYVPRGPLQESGIRNQELEIGNQESVKGLLGEEREGMRNEKLETGNWETGMGELWRNILSEARQEGVGWIRFDPVSNEALSAVKKQYGASVRKAPHDMQPREILVADISLSKDDILASMKSKTRYNIRLAEKHGVRVVVTHEKRYQEIFLDMLDQTARRKGIAFHTHSYYETFFASTPKEYWELFVAERAGVALAAIILVYFGDTAVYLHGASGDDDRSSMAPYLLQWEGMRRAREHGCVKYDFGGVDTMGTLSSLAGVTRFKIGFAPNVKTIQFPGSYDTVLKESHYSLYRALQVSKNIVIKAKRHLTKK